MRTCSISLRRAFHSAVTADREKHATGMGYDMTSSSGARADSACSVVLGIS